MLLIKDIKFENKWEVGDDAGSRNHCFQPNKSEHEKHSSIYLRGTGVYEPMIPCSLYQTHLKGICNILYKQKESTPIWRNFLIPVCLSDLLRKWMEHKAFEGLKLKLHNLEDYFRLVHYFGGWNMQSWCQWILPIFRITREVVQYTRWDKLEWQSLQIFRLDGREDITDQIGLQSSVWQTGITGNCKINYIFSFQCKLQGLASLEKQSKLPNMSPTYSWSNHFLLA